MTLTPAPAADPTPDTDLLRAVAGGRAEAAFAELVRRHGPLVYGVCRRVLADRPEADDAFQAVFLVLAGGAAAAAHHEALVLGFEGAILRILSACWVVGLLGSNAALTAINYIHHRNRI